MAAAFQQLALTELKHLTSSSAFDSKKCYSVVSLVVPRLEETIRAPLLIETFKRLLIFRIRKVKVAPLFVQGLRLF